MHVFDNAQLILLNVINRSLCTDSSRYKRVCCLEKDFRNERKCKEYRPKLSRINVFNNSKILKRQRRSGVGNNFYSILPIFKKVVEMISLIECVVETQSIFFKSVMV